MNLEKYKEKGLLNPKNITNFLAITFFIFLTTNHPGIQNLHNPEYRKQKILELEKNFKNKFLYTLGNFYPKNYECKNPSLLDPNIEYLTASEKVYKILKEDFGKKDLNISGNTKNNKYYNFEK